MTAAPYPKMKEAGGTLIREVLRTLKEAGLKLPIHSHILCGVSGGVDSVALARLVVRYGRKLASKGGVGLLHVNHGWRGEESDGDEKYVRKLAQDWGVPIQVFRLKASKIPRGESWEDVARNERQKIFEKLSKKAPSPIILTAHHADDLAETLLWRLFTGASQTHGAGIWVQDGPLVRPFLGSRKELLKRFLDEEGVSWREDRTNAEGRFLRSRMRRELMPAVESLFPQAVQHLVRLGLKLQGPSGPRSKARSKESGKDEYDLASVFFKLGKGRIRRAHWEAIENLRSNRRGELHLPDGWKLRLETSSKNTGERWVLEQPESTKSAELQD